jgi:hypothetical protein
MQSFGLIPGRIAALLYIDMPGGLRVPAIYMSKARGVVIGNSEAPLPSSGLPLTVQRAIHNHFELVFGLEHENWTGPGKSPRADYCDRAKPWLVVVSAKELEELE